MQPFVVLSLHETKTASDVWVVLNPYSVQEVKAAITLTTTGPPLIAENLLGVVIKNGHSSHCFHLTASILILPGSISSK